MERNADRWFRELGLPTFVPLRRWFTDLPRRVAPLVTAVTIVAFLTEDGIDDTANAAAAVLGDDEWIILAFIVAVLALSVAIAWIGFAIVRALLRRIPPTAGTVTASLLLVVCLAALTVGGYLVRPHATVGPAFQAIAVVAACVLVTGMGGGALLSWGARLAVRNASAVGHMASIALPVILMLVVFAFFSAEVWQMASALKWGSIALLALVVAVLAVVVVLRVCASEIDELRDALTPEQRAAMLVGTPVERRAPGDAAPQPLLIAQRINIMLVMAAAQLIQALLFAALLWALLVLIGGIAVPIGVVELWVGPGSPAHPLTVERLSIGGTQLPITMNLVKAAAVLAIISALPFVFSAVSEARYRERFFDPIMADMRRAMVVRDALVAGAKGARRRAA